MGGYWKSSLLALSLVLAIVADGAGTGFGRVRKDARWIGENPEPSFNPAQAGLLGLREKAEPKLPKNTVRFRRAFELPTGKIISAEAKACGLGFYEFWANGRQVDPSRLLAPGWSRPEHRILYDRYDLTDSLRAGETNVVGFWVSPGYSDDFMHWGWRWLRPKRVWMTLDVRYADGTTRRVVTDGSWQWTDRTPIDEVSIYHGESFDATREDPFWSCAQGSTAPWRAVREITDEKQYVLEENVGPAIRPYDPRPPAKTTHLGGDRWLLDFGVNRAGIVEMSLDLPRGHVVELRHAEEVAADGRSLDCRTLRTARACDKYAFGGNGTERYRPRFTYHGFRYVEVSGVPPEKMSPAAFRAYGVSADMAETATFACSDETLNWLFDSARRSIRSNAVSYPSDCPMRDERTPCLMDSNCAEDAAMLCFGMRDFYAKWLGDAARYEDGVAREHCDNDNPDWEGEPILLAERLLTHYAATNAVRREWGALKKVAADFERRLPADGVWKTGFGDWCPPDGTDWKSFHASVGVVNSALLAAEWRAMARVARALGETDDAVRYAALFVRATNDFAVAFLNRPGHACGEDRQSDLAVPLALDVVPATARPALVAALARRIRETDGGHVGTGIYGTRCLGDALLDNGLADLWWEVVHKTGYPGFETMRAAGATTLWEQWRANGGMNSHNHAMMSGAAACLLTHVAGFRVAADGRERLVIRPVFPSALNWVRATLETPRGAVAVNWHRTPDGPFVEVSAPTGMDVSLDLPKGATGRVTRLGDRADTPGGRFAELEPLPLGSITARGWLKEQMLRNKAGMGGHLDELEPRMIGTPWTTRETYERWGKNAPGWGAEISGNYWAGLIGLAFSLDDAELKDKAERWVQAVLKNAEPNGYLGTYTDKDDRFDDYCAGGGVYGYRALFDYAEATGRKDVMDAVHRALLWFCENWAGDRKTRYEGSGICTLMLQLYCRTGDRRLLDFSMDYQRFLEKKDLFQATPRAFASDDFEYNVNHAVAYVNRMSQPAMFFLATGEPFYRDASVRGVDKLRTRAYHVTGSASGNDEYLSRPSTVGESEYCGFAGAIDSYMRILWATGDTRYGDYAEETFFNAAQGARRKDEKAIQYFSSPNMIFATEHSSHTHMNDNLFGPVHSVACCAVRSVQVLPGFTRLLAMADRRGALVLTGYAPCTIRYRGCELSCDTLYPFKGEVVYTVKTAEPIRFAIRPKKPIWCEEMTVRVNGDPGASTDRVWKKGDTLSVSLAMPPRVARFDDRSAVQPLVVRRGPLVFSLPIREQWDDLGNGVESAFNGHAITKLPKGWAWWRVKPVADNKPTPNYEWQGYRRELMTWNVALDERHVDIAEEPNPKAGYVWEEPPVKLRLTAWKAPFAFPPYSNKATEFYVPEQTVTRPVPVTLVPFGCTALRITYFPRCDSSRLRKDLSFELP